MVDRTRVITAELDRLDAQHSKFGYYAGNSIGFEVRGQLLVRALRLFYCALGAFAASALIAVVGSALTAFDLQLSFRAAAVVGLLIGSSAVGCLVTGCFLMIRENQAGDRQHVRSGPISTRALRRNRNCERAIQSSDFARMSLLLSILFSDILPIFAIAAAGFLLARYAQAT
ncbi:MAG: hypothetical protein WDO18_17180 [Acidobacteriota bacterium]